MGKKEVIVFTEQNIEEMVAKPNNIGKGTQQTVTQFFKKPVSTSE